MVCLKRCQSISKISVQTKIWLNSLDKKKWQFNTQHCIFLWSATLSALQASAFIVKEICMWLTWHIWPRDSQERRGLPHHCYVTWMFTASPAHVYINSHILLAQSAPSIPDCHQFLSLIKVSPVISERPGAVSSMHSGRGLLLSCWSGRVIVFCWEPVKELLRAVSPLSVPSPWALDDTEAPGPAGLQSCTVVCGRRERNSPFPKACVVHGPLDLQNKPMVGLPSLSWEKATSPPLPSPTSAVSNHCPLLLFCLCFRHYYIKSPFSSARKQSRVPRTWDWQVSGHQCHTWAKYIQTMSPFFPFLPIYRAGREKHLNINIRALLYSYTILLRLQILLEPKIYPKYLLIFTLNLKFIERKMSSCESQYPNQRGAHE